MGVVIYFVLRAFDINLYQSIFEGVKWLVIKIVEIVKNIIQAIEELEL